MESKPWYAKGLRFECSQCGNCCKNHGAYTYVNLSPADTRRIAAHLGLSRTDFLREHCELEPGFFPHLRNDGEACRFLTAEGRCRIYPVRPVQCATWPFWRENLERETWDGPVRTCCPGIGQGPTHSAEEIERRADETERCYAEPQDPL